MHGAIRLRFTRLAQQIHEVLATGVHQMHVLNPLGLVDLVDRVRLRGAEVDLLVPAEHFHFRQHAELDRRQPRRDLERELRFFAVEQLELLDRLRRRHAVEVGRGDHQPHVFQRLHRDRRAVDRQARSDQHASFTTAEQLFPVGVDAGGEGIVLGLLIDMGQGREVAERQDDRT